MPTPNNAPILFHISMNVAELGRSVAFFRTLFDMEPTKLRADYAKFEPSEPRVVLSLEPAAEAGRSTVNHLGLRMPDMQSLVAMQERLEQNGLSTRREAGVECCYARQTKFWLHDPDGNLWEIYTLDGDLDHRGEGQTREAVLAADHNGRMAWEHRMLEPVPERIPMEDGSVEEVRLRGTFNASVHKEQTLALLAEVRRVLEPRGRLFVHALVGESAVDMPGLSGAASGVQRVPHQDELPRFIAEAGFFDIRFLKLDKSPCFIRDGVPMREMQLEAFAP